MCPVEASHPKLGDSVRCLGTCTAYLSYRMRNVEIVGDASAKLAPRLCQVDAKSMPSLWFGGARLFSPAILTASNIRLASQVTRCPTSDTIQKISPSDRPSRSYIQLPASRALGREATFLLHLKKYTNTRFRTLVSFTHTALSSPTWAPALPIWTSHSTI